MASIAMKVYDLQWFTTFGLDYKQAAASLRDDGVDTVLTQNQIEALPGSGVNQVGYRSAFAERLASYDDRAWVAALREAGLRVYQTTTTFFDPPSLARFSNVRPIDATGNPDQGFDWYVGICPTHEGYLAEKIDTLRRVTAELQPDGYFLQFTRYPGFWENWTPEYTFSDADRFCFCHRCRARFAADEGVTLPQGNVATQSRFILDNVPEHWTAWRCTHIADAVVRIAHALDVERPGIAIMLNTLPFPASDFDGLDVRREIASQDLTLLSHTVDRFELMTYLQILNRPLSWLQTAVGDARRQLPPNREIVCTLQVRPLYTDGIHAARGRPEHITAEDLEEAAHAALDAGADGLVFYHWTDFLQDEAAGGRKREALRAITAHART